jgi:hypothetical protein
MGMRNDEERFNDFIQRIAREQDGELEVPREEIWARIDAARAGRRGAGSGRDDGVIPLATRRRSAVSWLRWGSALAAMLVLGIAIGRVGRPGTGGQPLATADSVTRDRAVNAADSAALVPYRLAATQHLQRTEALLAALPADARSGDTEQVAGWAGELLTDTRLLLDSPAGRDVELGKLLLDLELVLAQIADLQPDPAGEDVEMIQDGINQRDVLLRLRAATARPPLAGS